MSRASLYLISIAAALALGAWFLGNFERVEHETTGTWEETARRNPFLAASLLMESVGFDSESLSTNALKDGLPDADAVVVLPLSLTVALSAELRGSLDRWVAAGGHLVLLLPNAVHERGEQWLETLNFTLFDYEAYGNEDEDGDEDGDGDEDEDEDEDGDGDGNGNADDDDADEQAEDDELDESTYYLMLYAFTYRLGFSLDANEASVLSDDYGHIVASLPQGGGQVTVVSAIEPFRNYNLSADDHARLLVDIVNAGGKPSSVLFFYDVAIKPLYALLWQWVPWMIVSCFIWLALWLWSRMPRFGPWRLFAPEAPRSIVEHVRAAGRLSWHQQAQHSLSQTAVAALIDKAARRTPAIRRQDRDLQIATLARLTDIPDNDVALALAESASANAKDFVRQLQRIQAIRNAL